MSSKRKLRRRQCEGKTAYPNQADARYAAIGARTRNNRDGPKFTFRNKGLDAYPCPHCSQWHIGHAPTKGRKRRPTT